MILRAFAQVCSVPRYRRYRAFQSRAPPLESSMAEEKQRQHGLGERNIVAAIQRRLAKERVKCIVSVGYQHHPADPPESIFEVVANGRSVELRFSYEDVFDSRERLSAGAVAKVNDLVARISRET